MKQNLTDWLELAQISANSILISGSEECAPLKHSLTGLCRQKLVGFTQHYKFNADRYFNLQEIQEIIQSNSLFADKNFIELAFKTKPVLEQQKQLIKLIPLLGEDNFLCISCDKLDKKDLGSEWLTILLQSTTHLALNADYAEGYAWALHLITVQGFNIEAEALRLLLEMNQGNLAQLHQEINKLCLLFKAPYTITLADAQNNLSDNAQYNIYALSNAYLSGNLQLAGKILRNVCQTVDEAILLIWNLSEDLRKLIRIKGNLKQNQNFNQAIAGLRIWGESITNFRQANQRLSYAKLLNYFAQLAQIDLCIKGVGEGDALILLEKLIINLCLGK